MRAVRFLCMLVFCQLTQISVGATLGDISSVQKRLDFIASSDQIRVEVKRTRHQAIVDTQGSQFVLTIDPNFLEQLSEEGLTFVVAHEYAHVILEHQKKLAQMAMTLTGERSEDPAFELLSGKPAWIEEMNKLNRQFELEADERASAWLRQLGMNPCDSTILQTFDTANVSIPASSSHPGYYQRREVVCKPPHA